MRLKLAIKLGCIPLVIQDDVKMPFEDVLPYQDFAVRLPQHFIHILPQILEGMLTEQSQRVRTSGFHGCGMHATAVASWVWSANHLIWRSCRSRIS